MDKCLVLFVEGDTEVEFYKRLIEYLRLRYTISPNIHIEYKNVKGIGGFKNTALRKFIKEIKPKDIKRYGKNCQFSVALCRDSDIFEFALRPPINWNEVEKDFLKNGTKNVLHIQAVHSIEDWFLFDVAGVLSFLELPRDTNIIGENGQEKIQKLFKKANKVYHKGMKSSGFIERLDIEKIEIKIIDQLSGLYEELGIEVNKEEDL